MTAIFIDISFDSAHWLPRVPDTHKCHAMHGHTYRGTIEAIGDVDPKMGWIVDYTELKYAWSIAHALLDHNTLNDVLENPTCGNLAEYIRLHMESAFPKLMFTVKLRETETCGAISFR